MVIGLIEIDRSMARCRSEAVEVRLRGRLAWGRRRATAWCNRGDVRQSCKSKMGGMDIAFMQVGSVVMHGREKKIPVGFVGFLHCMGACTG